MNDHEKRLTDVENFLAAMQPRPVRADLAHLPDEKLTLADRLLVAVGSCGALAACLIVIIGLTQFTTAVAPSHPAIQRHSLSEIEHLLAQK